MSVIDELRTMRKRWDLPLVMERLEFRRVVEVGVASGRHLKHLATCPGLLELVGVDPWLIEGYDSEVTQETMDAWHADLQRLDIASLYRMRSVTAAKLFDDGHFDLAYIDARHDAPSAYEDAATWWPKVRSGGVLGGHDFTTFVSPDGVFNNVVLGVGRFLDEVRHHGFFATMLERKPSWFVVKP